MKKHEFVTAHGRRSVHHEVLKPNEYMDVFGHDQGCGAEARSRREHGAVILLYTCHLPRHQRNALFPFSKNSEWP